MADLEDERLPCQLQLVLAFFDQFLQLEGLELHDVSNAQGL